MIRKRAIKYVIACAAALTVITTQSTQAAPIILDDFNVNLGHFGSVVHNGSGSSRNLASTSSGARITTEGPREGTGHQKLILNTTIPGTNTVLRHLSGGGSAANNSVITTSSGTDGWLGLYLKTTNTGWTVQIWLEGSGANNGGVQKELIADGEWHLYEWDLDNTAGDSNGWGNIEGILGGVATVPDGNHTIDSVMFRNTNAPASSTIYMDFVARNDAGSVASLLEDPCINTSGILVGGPLSTDSNVVAVSGVAANATAIKIYQDSGSGKVNIGSKTTDIVEGNNVVTVTGLIKNSEVVATQTINGQESCIPNAGIFVGGGANPSVKVALSIRETTDTGPVGASATTVGSTHIHFVGASQLSGGAPFDAQIIHPSNEWQTVTIGGKSSVANSANATGTIIPGNMYSPSFPVSIQVYPYKNVGDGRIYSSSNGVAQSASIGGNSPGNFGVKWTWDAVEGADGYRVLKTEGDFGITGNYDLTTNSFDDDGSIPWTGSYEVTPNGAFLSPTVQWNGPAGSVGTTNGLTTEWGILESIAFAIDSDTGPFNIFIDALQNGSTIFQSFETVEPGTLDYGFRQPGFSGSTGPGLLAVPNLGVVTNLTADDGNNSFQLQFQWNGTNSSKWLRLTTSGAGAGANPLVNLNDPISFRILLLPVGTVIEPPAQPPTISYSLVGDQLTLTWTGTHNLESKNNLSDATWDSVGVNTSPYVTTVSGGAKFYRLHTP